MSSSNVIDGSVSMMYILFLATMRRTKRMMMNQRKKKKKKRKAHPNPYPKRTRKKRISSSSSPQLLRPTDMLKRKTR